MESAVVLTTRGCSSFRSRIGYDMIFDAGYRAKV